jgi:amino acid transporter
VGIVIASSTLVSLGQGMGIAGYGFIYAMIAALILNLFVAFSFAELAGMIPSAGGINHYTLPTMGPFVGMMAALSGYVLVSVFAGSAESAIAGLVFHEVFAPWMNPTLFSVLIVAVLVLINIRGIELFGWVQIVLTAAMVGSLIVLGVIGITGMGGGEPVETSFAFNPMGMGVFALTALAFWLFVGVEFVCPLAEEIKKPRLYIPLAMGIALLIIFVAKTLYGFASLKYVPTEVLAGSYAPHVAAASAMMGRTGQVWIGIVSILATVSTVNTLLAAIPRILYGMAKNGQLPKVFADLSRWNTPWAAIVFKGVVFVLFLLTGIASVEAILLLILAGAFCWFITYIVAHLNVIILRLKYPDVKRSFKSPFGIVPQVLGILGMLYMMVEIFPDPVLKAEIYRTALLYLAITAAFSVYWIKVVMKKDLFEITPLEKVRAMAGAPDEEGYSLSTGLAFEGKDTSAKN